MSHDVKCEMCIENVLPKALLMHFYPLPLFKVLTASQAELLFVPFVRSMLLFSKISTLLLIAK